ncbi:MAG: pknB 19 [Verrucomicrobiaceae bacterium]|nr:pknB 19 [Verrucomicrobiaceae bacterium]
MPHSAPPPDSADEPTEDLTLQAAGLTPHALLRANAGRIFAEMLGAGGPGVEKEGDTLGPYRLCELLGEGGFGSVWRAEQREVVRREVALKVIKPGMDTAQVLGRFNQERQALAGLDHPHIAVLLDAGVDTGGQPWFAMELVRGENITSWCAHHRPALHERLRLFMQVCEAVEYAHVREILHRDLKPANVMVTHVDGRPTAKVIDFGIAKVMHGAAPADLTLLTRENQIVGTPVYMSPEQIEGGQELDARSDVYALGALLYELLTGLPPFDLDRLASADFSAVRRMMLDTEPERPSLRLRNSEAPHSPTWPLPVRLALDLDWITLRALEKDRERRYPSAADLAADVSRYLEGKPVLASPPEVAYRVGRWLRRRRRSIFAACAGAAATTVVIAALLNWPDNAQIPASAASAPPLLQLAADGSFTNSLDMKFVPVPDTDVMFCIHETRYRDFIAYLGKDFDPGRSWGPVNTPGVDPRAPTSQNLPVARINWEGARDFCKWLSRREGRTYRLPTDREWSCAVGIGKEEKWTSATTPENVFKNTTGYPWGPVWPPPPGAGNYRDLTRKDSIAENPGICLEGYRDGFATVAPVMTFAPDKLGLYDMGGNVMEWIADWANRAKTKRVLRGSGWDYPSSDYQELLLSSTRTIVDYARSDTQHPCHGFRVVLDLKPSTPAL